MGNEDFEKHRKISNGKILKTKREIECLSSIVQYTSQWSLEVDNLSVVYDISIMGGTSDATKYGGNRKVTKLFEYRVS